MQGAAPHEAKVPGVEPALTLQRRGGGGGVVEVPLGDVVAADPDAPDVVLGEPPPVCARDPDLHARERSSAAHRHHGVLPVRLLNAIPEP